MKPYRVDEDTRQISYDFILLSTIFDIKEAKKRGDWDEAFRLIDELEILLTPYGADKYVQEKMNGKEFKDEKERYCFKERLLLTKAMSVGLLPPPKIPGKTGGSNL